MTQRYRYQKLWPAQFYPMTREQRDTLVDAPEFLTIANIDDKELQCYINNEWKALAKYAPGGSADIYGTIHNFADATTALEVRRTQTNPIATLDPATTGNLLVPPVDHTHAASISYKVEIDGAGAHGVATFKWSDDGGSTWDATGLAMVDETGLPVTIVLQEGIQIRFEQGTYTLGDYWTWTAIGTATQLYDLRVDTTNSRVDIGTQLRVANDPDFALYMDSGNPRIRFQGINEGSILYDRTSKSLFIYSAGSPIISLSLDANDKKVTSLGDGYFQLSNISILAVPGSGSGYLHCLAGRLSWRQGPAPGTESALAFTSELPDLAAHVAAGDPHTGYVLESLYDAQTILAATTDNTPVAVAVAEQKVVGRVTGGNIAALSLNAASGILQLDANGRVDPTQTAEKSVRLIIENPTASEDIGFGQLAQGAVTITKVVGVLTGDYTSVTINPKHGTDRSAAGTALFSAGQAITSTTTGTVLTTFADATLAAGEFLWLETTAKAGTTGNLELTVYFTED